MPRTILRLLPLLVLSACASAGERAYIPPDIVQECRAMARSEAFRQSFFYDGFWHRRRFAHHGFRHRHRSPFLFDDPFFWRISREQNLYSFCLRSRADEIYAGRARKQALEQGESGPPTVWRNPDSGSSGSVTAAPAPAVSGENGPCREFQQSGVIDGKTEKLYGTACREPDGSWRIVKPPEARN